MLNINRRKFFNYYLPTGITAILLMAAGIGYLVFITRAGGGTGGNGTHGFFVQQGGKFRQVGGKIEIGGKPAGGPASIPVTFVNGKSAAGGNSALGGQISGGTGCPTDVYCLTLPQKSLSGNFLYLAVEYSTTATNPTVATDKSQSFTALSVTGVESSKKLADFYLANATAGTSQIQITEAGGVTIKHVMLLQFAGVSGLDGSVEGANAAAANNTITAASITPSTGDLVLMTGCLAGTPGRTSFTAGTGQSGITWTKLLSDITKGCMVQFGTWSGSGAFTPQMTTAGTASTFLATTAAFTASASQGTLPTGIYLAGVTEIHNPVAGEGAGNRSFEVPSTGNALVMHLACGAHTLNTITDAVNTWTILSPQILNGTASAYVANASTNSNGAITVNFQGGTGDCDGYVYDIYGADAAPLGNRMQLGGTTAVAGNFTYFSGNYVPGLGAGLQFMTSSDGGNTCESSTAPSGAIAEHSSYGGQLRDGPSLPSQNNCFFVVPFSGNAATTYTATFNDPTEAIGTWVSEVVSLRSSGAGLNIFSPQITNSPTVSSNKLSVTLTPRSGSLLWAFVGWDNTSATMSCSDPNNGTWTAVDSPVNGTAGTLGGMSAQTFYVSNVAGSSTKVTCTASGTITTGKAWLAVHEIVGVSTLDQHPAIVTSNSSATGSCNTTGTTAAAAEYVATGIIVGNSISQAQPAFTIRQFYNAGTFGDSSGDIVVASTGTYTANWTLDINPDAYMCAINTFK